MKTISIRVPDSLKEKLESRASDRNINEAELVREAIETFLEIDTREGFDSCYDMAPQFAGCIESGVTDLATNLKYMEGFGE